MFDPNDAPAHLLVPLARVVETALTKTGELMPGDVMLVGAWCRDIIHVALGHTFGTTATHDLDLALALPPGTLFAL